MRRYPIARLFCLLLCIGLLGLQPTRAVEPERASFSWNGDKQGKFIVALAAGAQGQVWVGTEDQGVWRYNPQAIEGDQWTQFTTKDGLGDDNAYALAVDRLGRVWVGHLNHGVSVFNGQTWRNYGVFEGPLGERVFAIATCPTDGDVWIATNAGLSRYSLQQHLWFYYTRADGLVSDAAQSLAFDARGNLYAGTPCDGLMLASPKDDYKTWRNLRGAGHLPLHAMGKGLPSNLINCVCVGHDGTVYVGTPNGLARSDDAGGSWQYVRGRDYADKVRGLAAGAPEGWQEEKNAPLSEDYVTCLAEDAAGMLWVGHRQTGYEVFSPQQAAPLHDSAADKAIKEPTEFVGALLPLPGQPPLVGRYGNGLIQSTRGFERPVIVSEAPAAGPLPHVPALALPPDLPTLVAWLGELKAVPLSGGAGLAPSSNHGLTVDARLEEGASPAPPDSPAPVSPTAPVILPLDDDWSSQGDWIDRYGNFAGILCAMGGHGNDYLVGYRASWFQYRGWSGRNKNKDDFLRYWVHWVTSDNPRVLQNPVSGGRKQSEWDDHGEEYPTTKDGPNVCGTFKLFPGNYTLALYFHNKDGHDSPNFRRDYLVEVKATPMDAALYKQLGTTKTSAEKLFEATPGGATARVTQFWGGVYKRFCLVVPATGYYTIRVGRNHSHNSILSAILIDPMGELCGPEGPTAQPARPRPRGFTHPTTPTSLDGAAKQLIDCLLYLRGANPVWYATRSRHYALPLLRLLLTPNGEPVPTPCLAAQIMKSGKYPKLREDVAALLNDLHLFARRDHVYYDERFYQRYQWQNFTALGQKTNWNLKSYAKAWNWHEQQPLYKAFVRQQRQQQGW